ncbi:MAG: hypothetical protein L0Y67_09265 [Gammaproteobacteria bacterium]|nr:hypothetical protein [Gammaproteobacteria bacterium]
MAGVSRPETIADANAVRPAEVEAAAGIAGKLGAGLVSDTKADLGGLTHAHRALRLGLDADAAQLTG